MLPQGANFGSLMSSDADVPETHGLNRAGSAQNEPRTGCSQDHDELQHGKRGSQQWGQLSSAICACMCGYELKSTGCELNELFVVMIDLETLIA